MVPLENFERDLLVTGVSPLPSSSHFSTILISFFDPLSLISDPIDPLLDEDIRDFLPLCVPFIDP